MHNTLECIQRKQVIMRCYRGDSCVYKDTVHSDSIYYHRLLLQEKGRVVIVVIGG
jgi:hypothetical protein